MNAEGTVNVRLSDPPTCKGMTVGSFDHIYVTIRMFRSIRARLPAPATPAGWI